MGLILLYQLCNHVIIFLSMKQFTYYIATCRDVCVPTGEMVYVPVKQLGECSDQVFIRKIYRLKLDRSLLQNSQFTVKLVAILRSELKVF